MTPIRVVVADDDVRVRRDFRALLELESDIEVLAVVPDGSAAVEICSRLHPDVVVMDVRMPSVDGIEATRLLRSSGLPTRVLVVTTFDLDQYVMAAVRAGASGFLVKDQAPERLAEAVRIVASGDAVVSPRATARLLQEFVDPAPTSGDSGGRLTAREEEVVRLMARGLSNDDIAMEALISRATVKTHVSSILSKLGLSSRIQIVVWAYEHGFALRR